MPATTNSNSWLGFSSRRIRGRKTHRIAKPMVNRSRRIHRGARLTKRTLVETNVMPHTPTVNRAIRWYFMRILRPPSPVPLRGQPPGRAWPSFHRPPG